MASINKKTESVHTHEGAVACKLSPKLELKRTVMACLLWEDQFYEDGVSIAERIKGLIAKTSPEDCMEIAIEARSKMNLRHVPLLIAREMARLPKHKALVSLTLSQIIQRPDELTEFLALYWKDGKEKLSAQVKKGLAKAFPKFSEYQLAKYNRDNAIKLKDVLFLCHAKPKDSDQELVWQKLIDNKLQTPDTWEVNLSAGKDKKETWERLLKEKKLGGLALLRNLRNMTEANVDFKLLDQSLVEMKTDRILPYRFIAAARYAPRLEPQIEVPMLECLKGREKLQGSTLLLVDVSGSMDDKLSVKSEMKRIDAACGLAILLREVCDGIQVFSFSERLVEVPPRRGFALRDAILSSQPHGGTRLGGAIEALNKNKKYDRIIVFTDEQSHDSVPAPISDKAYIINMASYKHGVGYGNYTHIDGFSEAIVDYIFEIERKENR